jgi:hypothetical protein
MKLKRLVVGLVATAGLTLTGVSLSVRPAAADYASCPEVTDSVERLYAAYFLRQSDAAGLQFWNNEYMSGNRNLVNISDWFAQSPEFISRYGALTDAQFVRQVYVNVLGREPDPDGFNFWLGRLAARTISRGNILVNFSESPEFVAKTHTVQPLAGYFNYYPPGTTIYCGYGQETRRINKRRTGPMFVDVLGTNFSGGTQSGVVSMLSAASTTNAVVWDHSIAGGGTYYLEYNVPFDVVNGQQSTYIDIDGMYDAYWTVVVHTGTVDSRAGW